MQKYITKRLYLCFLVFFFTILSLMTDFHLLIADWYRLNKRDLPWRTTKNPYFIWLSEVIMQQTRVDQGLNYYLKFTENYPKIEDLATADEQEILNDWQGLGYYSRARNLHVAAKHIHQNLKGEFPNTFKSIQELKGVGPYTAAAIASFAFNEKVAVVDGNVYRVLSRIFDIEQAIDSSQGKKTFQELADSLISSKEPGEFNQAIMEFGALQCTPTNPKCENCPFEFKCLAKQNQSISIRPVKSKKTKIRQRFFYFSIFTDGISVVLEKREKKDIWQHLFEFPLIETKERLTEIEIIQITGRENIKIKKISEEYKHILSHQHLFAKFIHFNSIPTEFSKTSIAISDIENHPLPRLIDRYLEENKL